MAKEVDRKKLDLIDSRNVHRVAATVRTGNRVDPGDPLPRVHEYDAVRVPSGARKEEGGCCVQVLIAQPLLPAPIILFVQEIPCPWADWLFHA